MQVTETELLACKGGSTEAERASPSGGKDNLWKDRPFAAEISASSPILKGHSDKERYSLPSLVRVPTEGHESK